MAELRVLSGAEVCGILGRHGFVRDRQAGGHIIMQRTRAGRTTTIPVPNHTEVKIGTLRSIIRRSGVPRAEFET